MPKLRLLWTAIYMLVARELACKSDDITARHGNARQRLSSLSFLPFSLPSFFLLSLCLRCDIRQFDRAISDIWTVERKTNYIYVVWVLCTTVASSARARDSYEEGKRGRKRERETSPIKILARIWHTTMILSV